MNKYVDELPEENVKSTHCEERVTGTGRPVLARGDPFWHGETRWNITEGTINSTITFILEDVGVDRSTEVERHSCRRLRQHVIRVIQGPEDNDADTTSSGF